MNCEKTETDYAWLYIWASTSADFGYDVKNKEWYRRTSGSWGDRSIWKVVPVSEVPVSIVENKLIVFG